MRKLTNLFCVLFAILVTVASCSPDDTDFTDDYINQENTTILKRNQNNSERQRKQDQGSRGQNTIQKDSIQESVKLSSLG